jgi:type I restriction enzyme S subunit
MRCDRTKILPEFVVAYFKTMEGRHQLLASTSQVGVPSIAQPVTYLRTIEIPLLPLPEQRAIAHILGTLDDKIELNRRMNETLEAMARALFKSWFVNFDPVRAKAKGRNPGLPKPLAELFPACLVDSELGEIPAGWGITNFPEEIDFLEGPGLRNWQYRDAGMKFLNIRYIVDGDLDIASLTFAPEPSQKIF